MSIALRYTREIHNGIGHLATWLPATTIKLAHIGVMDEHNAFVPQAPGRNYGLSFATDESEATANFSFASAKDYDYDIKLKGQTSELTPNIPKAQAGIGIKFSGAGASFFQLDGVTHTRVLDQIDLAKQIMRLARAGKWDRDWVVVTEVFRADIATILVSMTDSASIEIAVSADLGALGISALTAGVDTAVAYRKALQTELVAVANTTPLFRAVRVKNSIFSNPKKVVPAYEAQVDEFIEEPEPEPKQMFENVTPKLPETTIDS